MKNNLLFSSLVYSGMLELTQKWFHAAHHCSKGAQFEADHKLYGDIYQAAFDTIDKVIEKQVAKFGEEAANPYKRMHIASSISKKIGLLPPIKKDPENIASLGLSLVKNFISATEGFYEELEANGQLSMGMDDLLMTISNDFETFEYKLQQRVNTHLENMQFDQEDDQTELQPAFRV